ncbi:MAG: hypothetical protein A2233_02470 [Candidatus Kerfeldbacteria bacterium RIFOXYA2_FULL_38_24]|uniref:Uncharacterized protein n=1 Tax=Candidatus Kerfeldbacteria bacterium RIFOXYB2_FULL_38_14 TaxID=1798547 RepID=A0A1G2BC24_9BACT|nr:MAG: hypothetical protein A2233_02470 [Candidatus Kerfeldbacteria bacterium RIFOXYA2_FULL_38_24]OGY85840.1 MAG: hypothetical protein A2319_05800 [Candidatus Kerfeldbacteria bacterium RIFOXYB2_FULL_38_14]OGY89121.1 MAG: hypothetical protein A2458_02585 [Candidatus Kerfeldbacteria bacterium RIFOXYC2_FULL_38_9]
MNKQGYTLIESLIAIVIFMIVAVALYLSIILTVSILRDDQARLDALSIAQNTIEEIRNVPYDDVGTTNGIPHGVFDAVQTVTQNKTEFTIKTDIRYIDDPLDGTAPADAVNTDYKKVEVNISWKKQFLTKPVTLITNVVPEGIETNENGGTLWLEVYNAAAEPISNATLKITNNQVTPAIDITAFTDQDGRYILPGAPVAVSAYHVEISKNGYSQDQTYSLIDLQNQYGSGVNSNPDDLTVVEADITSKAFIIDVLSHLTIHVENRETAESLVNIPVTIQGSKSIGTYSGDGSPILKFNLTQNTNENGDIDLPNMEYDTYSLAIADDTYDFAGSNPHSPYVLAPNTTTTLAIKILPHAPQTLLLSVQDRNEAPLAGASVHLYNSLTTIDLTNVTDDSGQVFFSPLSEENFTLEILKDGYDPHTEIIPVLANQQHTITLTEPEL